MLANRAASGQRPARGAQTKAMIPLIMSQFCPDQVIVSGTSVGRVDDLTRSLTKPRVQHQFERQAKGLESHERSQGNARGKAPADR